MSDLLTLSGPEGGGEGLRGQNDQIHSCHSETSYSIKPKLCNFCFYFKTSPEQILAKLISQGPAAALFSSRRLKNFGNEKILPWLKIAEVDMGSILGRG